MALPPFEPARTLQLNQGRSRDFELQVANADGTPALNVFQSSDTLAATLWSGDGVTASATPTAIWLTTNGGTGAPGGQYVVTFQNADTASLAPGTYFLEATFTRAGRTGTIGWFKLFLVDAAGTSTGNAIDLVTIATVQAAIGNVLPADQSYIAGAITAASQAVIQYLGGQNVKQQTYDQILLATTDGFILPPQQPLNDVLRIAGGRSAAMTLQNTSGAVQWATVSYAQTGDVATGFTVTGLTLTWALNGTTTPQTILFSSLSPATVQSLATAINGNGTLTSAGWNATVQGNFGGWAVSELVTNDVAAQDGINGAYLEIWSQNLTGARIKRPGNVIDIRQCNTFQGSNIPFAWSFGGGLATGTTKISRPEVRCIYNAGYATVPPAIQQATIEVCKILFERLATDMTLRSESADGYSWGSVGPEAIEAIPKAVRQALDFHRVRWIGTR